MRRFALSVFLLTGLSSFGFAADLTTVWDAAHNDPKSFRAQIGASKTLGSILPGASSQAEVSWQGAMLDVSVPMQPGSRETLKAAEVSAVAALVWAGTHPAVDDVRKNDESPVVQVTLSLEWPDAKHIRLIFPARSIDEHADGAALIGVLDEASVSSISEGVRPMISPSCAAYGARNPHFCSIIAGRD